MKYIIFLACLAAIIWYFFFALPKAFDQAATDFRAWKRRPDTVIVFKNGRFDTTITIKK
jgi:hypothetical protein